jgi:hypothetical protein
MIAPARTKQSQTRSPRWHRRFLQMLPAIRRYAAYAFRHHPRETRSELVAEVVANACVAFVRLVQQGRADLAYPTPLAMYGVRQVRDGRRVGTARNSRDVLSPAAQQKHGFDVKRLNPLKRAAWQEAVAEDHRTAVADQAAFRCDFPEWLRTLSRRNRRLAQVLATGESTAKTARKFRLSPARVSQLRREFAESWQRFHGDELAAPAAG